MDFTRDEWRSMTRVSLGNWRGLDSFVINGPPSETAVAMFDLREFAVEERDRRYSVLNYELSDLGQRHRSGEEIGVCNKREEARILAYEIAKEAALRLAEKYGVKFSESLMKPWRDQK